MQSIHVMDPEQENATYSRNFIQIHHNTSNLRKKFTSDLPNINVENLKREGKTDGNTDNESCTYKTTSRISHNK